MILTDVEKAQLKKIPDVKAGDTARVFQGITEGGKSRIQVFEGVVLSRTGGRGLGASILVRKIASGVGVEKTFLLHSPLVEKVEVVKSAKTRRAKLYYLRGLTGKAAKLKEKQKKKLEEIGVPITEPAEESVPQVEELSESPAAVQGEAEEAKAEKPVNQAAPEAAAAPAANDEPELAPAEEVPTATSEETKQEE